ncbi:kinase-like domain-containing protein [Emericellopsis atlantica]|uniref:Kinase-like domain-containing protein n=1 Tax=Emericellopsis atlantica TaxID=2614577 RepID=A0A9P7ZK97_9HYPO|nr:kinase-like domain-containing protein [Emericellopsis atlantica]KAG9253038.1 kinase-like domain-containing protein [Emericellopsis atlantica]
MTTPTSKTLPSRPEEVDAAWLTKVLNLPITKAEQTDIILDASAGKIYITASYNDKSGAEKTLYLCVKGGFNPQIMAMPDYVQVLKVLYTREIKFFQDIAPELRNVNVPKAYWAGVDPDQFQAIVILEDLSKEHTFGDCSKTMTLEQVKVGASQLAGLHSSKFNISSSSEEYSWMTNVYDFAILQMAEPWEAMILADNRPPFQEQWKDKAKMHAVIKKHFAKRDPRYLALVHGDPHAGNTFLDKSGNPSFLDFQTAHISSIFHDLTYFLVGALTVENRRAHEMEVLEHYLSELHRFGGPALSKDDESVQFEYKKNMLSGIGWCLTPYEMQREYKVRAMCERYVAAMVDHNTIDVIESAPEAKA